jgi:hypothetical protein
MSSLRPTLLVALGALAAAAVTAVAVGASPPSARDSAAAKISPVRVDGVHLGDTHTDLRARGKVGKIRRGCELGGPDTRSARLLAPLEGSVNYTLEEPRSVETITVRGGARARGVGIGATIPRIKAKFPRARINHNTDEVFQVTLVQTPRRPRGGRITFAVSTRTHRTTLIGVPFIAFCE